MSDAEMSVSVLQRRNKELYDELDDERSKRAALEQELSHAYERAAQVAWDVVNSTSMSVSLLEKERAREIAKGIAALADK